MWRVNEHGPAAVLDAPERVNFGVERVAGAGTPDGVVLGQGVELVLVLREDLLHQGAEAAVEQTFVNKDGVATLKLGQARGIAMLVPAMFGLSVAEYAPNQVKKTVVGAGHADKNQVLVMLKILLPKAEPASSDAADALALAITHAHHRSHAALRLKVVGI